MRILVRRSGALGDVILSTPVIRRLRRENPDAEITIQTAYPDVFKDNPHVNQAAYAVDPIASYDRFIDLDLAYEKRPMLHIVDAYMIEAFCDTGSADDKQQELFFKPAILPTFDRNRHVAVHATQAGWSNRTLPRSTWISVIGLLRDAGLRPILIGTSRDNLIGFNGLRILEANIAMHAALISDLGCFIGSDSGLLHVAGATDIPIVGVFTCARPELRLPVRGGVLGKDCKAVEPALDCKSCLGRRVPPVTTEWCERGDNACVGVIQAVDIVDAVFEVMKKARE